MDSYEKFACDMLGSLNPSFLGNVLEKDRAEVAVQFALVTSGLMYADNYRVYPMHMRKEYDAIRRRGCCGFMDSVATCVSGNRYLIGCNFGH